MRAWRRASSTTTRSRRRRGWWRWSWRALERLLGISLTSDEVAGCCVRWASRCSGDGRLAVTVPDHRLDVVRLGGRGGGDRPRATGTTASRAACRQPALPPFRPDPSEPRHRVRRILAGLGLDEVVLHALIGRGRPDALRLRRRRSQAGAPRQPAGRAAQHHAAGRRTPRCSARWPRTSGSAAPTPWLFEVGKTYWMGGSRGPATAETAGSGRWEAWHATHRRCWDRVCRRHRARTERGCRRGDPEGPRGRAACRRWARRLRHTGPRRRRSGTRTCIPAARPGSWTPAARDYGSLGEVHPRVAAAWGLPGRPVIAVRQPRRSCSSLVPEEVAGAPGARRPAGRPRPGGVGGRGHAAG